MSKQTMGGRVRAARRARNLTQDQLARAIGISRNAVTQLELGNTSSLSADHAQAAAVALGTTLDYLLHGEQPKEKWAVGDEPRKIEATPDEVEIVLAYRASPAAMRSAWRQLARASTGR